jgi:S-adenosylhomocysteine hydrolase
VRLLMTSGAADAVRSRLVEMVLEDMGPGDFLADAGRVLEVLGDDRLGALVAGPGLGRLFPGRGTEQKWHSLRAQYQMVLPELARWQLRPDRPFSLRAMARWMEIEGQLGPRAAWQEKVAAYQRSPEFQQDSRIPSQSAVAQWRSQFRELLASPRERGYHRARGGGSPEAIDAGLLRDILATPAIPPLLRTALKRLDGRLPFKYHNVMFINHRYSDIVPFAESMIGAGMVAENSVFVSTPYPFNSAVDLQLRQLGLKTRVPKLSMKDYARQVEAGIRDMLKLHKKNGRTILILDDGGMASKIIAEKFKDHVGKFKIVEITAAGHRLAGEFKAKYQRLPFVYYSIAYTDLKRRVTSKFFGTRVVDRTLNLVEQSRLPLRNKEAVVIGGGPMGEFAGERLRALGFEVTFVEPDVLRADLLRHRFKTRPFKVAPIEEALRGKSLILGMSGYQTLRPEHIELIEPDAVIAQGSSKRNEFDMTGISRLASHKQLIPRTDGLAQKSYSYTFGKGSARKRLHFLGDGWTINHDGSLHGTPIEDIQLELAVIFESAAQAAQLRASETGEFREVGGEIQRFYLSEWQRLKRQKH